MAAEPVAEPGKHISVGYQFQIGAVVRMLKARDDIILTLRAAALYDRPTEQG
jgi:hypothetical protein